LNPGKIDLAEGDFKNQRKPFLSLGQELPEGHVEESGKVEKNDSPSSYPSTDGIQRIPLFIREQCFWGADRRAHGDFRETLRLSILFPSSRKKIYSQKENIPLTFGIFYSNIAPGEGTWYIKA
jgi:hypothetical protein